MSNSKVSILAVSILLLVLTVFLGYNFGKSDSETASTNEVQQNTNDQEQKQTENKSANQPPNQQSQQASESKISYVDDMPKKVAITVNGEELSTEDFDRRLHKTQFVFNAQGKNFAEHSKEILKELEDTVINELILEMVVMQLATEFKIVASDAEVQQRLAMTKQNFTAEEWQALLDSRGITEENLNTYNKIQLTQANLINWLGGEQQYVQYVDKKIKEAKVTVNKPLIEELISKL